MNKSVIVGVIAIVIIAGGAYFAFHNKYNKTPATSTTSSSSGANNSTPGTSTSGSASQNQNNAMDITITANDTSASPETINVAKGQAVNLTFKVSSDGTYHGGLEFKSSDPALDSGSIAEGNSGSVNFTATKSFKFTPYWYQSNVQKDYFVNVNVQ